MTSLYRSVFMAGITVAIACAADPTAFDGTWKLNTGKSKFESPAKKAHTITIANGVASSEETLSDGTERRWSHKTADGEDTQISGLENSSVTPKRIDDRTVTHTWKMGNRTSSGRGVVSADGKTMTYTLTGKTPDSKPFKDVMVFEKQ